MLAGPRISAEVSGSDAPFRPGCTGLEAPAKLRGAATGTATAGPWRALPRMACQHPSPDFSSDDFIMGALACLAEIFRETQPARNLFKLSPNKHTTERHMHNFPAHPDHLSRPFQYGRTHARCWRELLPRRTATKCGESSIATHLKDQCDDHGARGRMLTPGASWRSRQLQNLHI